MTIEIKNWILSSILVIFLIHTSYIVNADAETIWDEESQINVSIVGNSIINLDSDNKLLRAYVDIVNHNPADGYYYLQIIQPGTDKIISEEEIIIRKKSNDKAGADVAHMFNEEEISINDSIVLGDYTLVIFSEKGNSIGTTIFSIIKPSASNISYTSKVIEDINDSSDTESVEKIDDSSEPESVEDSVSESIANDPQLENIKKIPDWVKNIFVLYADGSISENELISALKFLIEQGIIEVN